MAGKIAVVALSVVAGAGLAVYVLDWIVRFESDELGRSWDDAVTY